MESEGMGPRFREDDAETMDTPHSPTSVTASDNGAREVR